MEFTVDQPESLQLDAQGGWPIDIAVSDTIDQSDEVTADGDADAVTPSRNTWRIEYVQVTLFGRTQ